MAASPIMPGGARVLDLCCGTKGTRRAMHQFPPFARGTGCTYTGLDVDARWEPDILCDIMEWDYRAVAPGTYNVVFAFPPCNEFSDVNTRGDGSGYAAACRIVRRVLDIIDHLRPALWVIENPKGRRARSLWRQGFMRRLAHLRRDVNYCRYGFGTPKPTCFWSNVDWTRCPPLLRCTAAAPCRFAAYRSTDRDAHPYNISRLPLERRYAVPLPVLMRFLEAAHHGHLLEYATRARR